MNRTTMILAAALALPGAGACGERLPVFDEALSPMAPAAVEDHVVVVERTRSEAHRIDVSRGADGAVTSVATLPRNPLLVAQRRGSDPVKELLVLCAGQPDDGTAPPADPALAVVPASGEPRVFPLKSAFNRIVQSDDGKYAFLFFDGNRSNGSGTLLFNPHEVAIVDLDGEGEASVNARALRSLDGSTTRHVVFSPPLDVNGETRRLAVVLFASDIAVLDLNHPERGEFTVPLSRSGGPSLGLEQVIFSTRTNTIFVRGAATNDVYVVAITPKPAGAPGPNDFELSRSQIFAGGSPSDLALYEENGLERLLVTAPGSRQAVIVEPDTNRTTALALDVAAHRILIFEGPSPTTPDVATRALLFTQGGSSVTFVDLGGIEAGTGRETELVGLTQPIARLESLGGALVMLLHQSDGLSLLDLHQRTVSGISGPNLADATADPSVHKLWLAPRNQARLGFLDLDGFHPEELRLDAPIEGLVSVPSATSPKVAAAHIAWAGHLTIVDAEAPQLGTAFSVRGFLREGVLDNGGRR